MPQGSELTSGSVQVHRDWPDPAEQIGDLAVKFTLTYDGPLVATTQSDNRTKEKHDIRKQLSFQLGQLWTLEPALSSRLKHLNKFQIAKFEGEKIVLPARRATTNSKRLYRVHSAYKFPLDGFCFIPLVTAHNNLLCELDILMLRDGDPGHVVRRNGDLDNRIKTLFDALRMPHSSPELAGAKPEDDQPFFCLLEDDCLITKIGVNTQRRLRKKNEPSTWVEMRICVNVIARKVTDYNGDYLTG
jgi:hypothetical protein